MNSESIIDFLIKTAPGIVAAIVASKLAVGKFYKEKNWERKERAYSEVINSLYNMIKYFQVHKEDYGQGTGLSKERESELLSDYINSASSLSKAGAIGSFYISKQAYNVLLELKKREQLDFHQEPMFDVYETEYKAHQNALDKFLEVARRDLRIK